MKRGLGALCGFAATVAFAVYNGALGAVCASPWHGSICAYYLLLSAARGLLLWGQRRERLSETDGAGLKRRYLCAAGGMILVMDLALAAPVILLVLDQRAASMGMIPAITSATYTTYKVTAAAVGLKRTPKDPFLRGLSALRFADALVSVLVLQNTLLLAVDGGITEDMLLLCLVSSAALFAVICVVTAVMGWKTYHQVATELSPDEWVYATLTSYIITHRACPSTETLKFVQEDPCEAVRRLPRRTAQEKGQGEPQPVALPFAF